MKKIISFFILSAQICLGQRQGNTWYFGDHAGLNFNTNPPTPLLNGQTDLNLPTESWNEGCSSISDSTGALLFYTNGVTLWNRQQGIMPNGSGLMGNKSSAQSAIIVPQPNNSQFFYVFTNDAEENQFENGLRYSVVDMCLDGNKGDVVTGEKNILLVGAATEKLACVQHSNGVDYWIIAHKFNTDIFYAFKLTAGGINSAVVSYTGTTDAVGTGQMAASPNGQKIVYNIPSATPAIGKSLLLDFDPSTGIVSNEQTLASGGREWGAAFSPDNSKLYCSTSGFGAVFQYDLNAGNLAAIIASKTFIINNGSDSWRHQQPGPDGKIYLSRTGKKYLSVIDHPNNFCPSCNYIDSAIYLGGKNTSFGLPGFIAGYKYSNSISGCYDSPDPCPVTAPNIFSPNNDGVNDYFFITDPCLKSLSLVIYNRWGEEVCSISSHSGKWNGSDKNGKRCSEGVYYYVLNAKDVDGTHHSTKGFIELTR